ncbi:MULTISPECIES: polyprenyl synthetase family protein [unclassified Clostridioides]|uniref:polyprenyl synthetase family protein n=1 Tax=unclassified Clostridioides TaxID=2635829 RepID=UPI001D0C124B|nr:polyprenyl synthetase family protein [Clostridioides sp. ES-S-0001-02]MCC0640516.1 polyprenyl synthetase family protein [Clostridioides sp. ES-S-0049-03]MCC0651695.1 polyprenyl synthetase family protein [Clostridioides sp. ES-S-0001-03]MCC0657503.1 polyprenyl synthetase family protein [Clostridioides sp. ES-S-0123-01]MCC0672909.1 polyprenyl synthetase family protein [Clostridioides sp. ES-S-0145-01]MCC0676815.1 polyprenyl synthetase family protein [Clostridioides sp. ES-W-0018-02]MCC067877
MEFKQHLKEKASFIEDILKEYMPKEEGYQKTVIEAMNYSLSAGGKRLRPILTLEACKVVGGNEEEAIPFAIAIEMIHTYSLIHDDLPALDNDDLRRGRPTNHKVYGEAMGILAGDALLNYAFEVMLAGSINKENPEKYLKAINEIAKGAGIYGMIGGQVVDVESENKQIEKEKLDYIHMNKTAAMMVGCMRAGATIGGANSEQMEEITKYAKNIGLSFQIVDDILDIVGDEIKLGKKVGSDIENHKSTYPSLLGLDKSKEIAHNLIDEAKKSIEKLSDNVDFLKGLAEYIIDREY